MSEIIFQKILSNQDKIFNKLADIEKSINDMQDGQRTLYVGQRNLDMELKTIKSELVFLKFTVKDDVVKKINVLIDDNQKKIVETKSPNNEMFEEFAKARANITPEDVEMNGLNI